MKFVSSKIFDLFCFCWWDGSKEHQEPRGVAETSREHCEEGERMSRVPLQAKPGEIHASWQIVVLKGLKPQVHWGQFINPTPHWWPESTAENSRPGESWGQEEQDTEGTDLGNWKQFLYQAVVVAGACLEVHMQSVVPWQWPVPAWNKVDPHHRATSTEYRSKIPLSTPLWRPSKLLCTRTFWRIKFGREVIWETENLFERNFYKNKKKFWTRRAGDIINWKL